MMKRKASMPKGMGVQLILLKPFHIFWSKTISSTNTWSTCRQNDGVVVVSTNHVYNTNFCLDNCLLDSVLLAKYPLKKCH